MLPSQTLVACIDDDEPVRKGLDGLLRAFGYAVEVFSSAEDFLHSGVPDRFSCLITDIKLGGQSGLELQRSLYDAGYRIPTIVITAFENGDLLAEALAAGAVGFFRKPVNGDDLMIAVAKALIHRSEAT